MTGSQYVYFVGAEEPATVAAVNMFTGPVVSLTHAKMKFYKLLRAKGVFKSQLMEKNNFFSKTF